MSTRTCQTCGIELTDGVNFCPNCGTQVIFESGTDTSQTNAIPDTQESSSVGSDFSGFAPTQTAAENPIPASSVPYPPYIPPSDIPYSAPMGYPSVTAPVKKARKWVLPVIIAAVVLVLAASAVIFFFLREQKSQKIRNGYIDNLNTVTGLMIIGGGDAEELCNLTARVWRNCIWEDADSETDKFTKPYGFFYDDFNDALNTLYSDDETLDTLSNIIANQSLVKSVMEELREPPQEFEKCYDTLTELYSAYQGLTDLALSPVGSFNSYTDSKNSKVDKFLEYYKKVNNLIPEKK